MYFVLILQQKIAVIRYARNVFNNGNFIIQFIQYYYFLLTFGEFKAIDFTGFIGIFVSYVSFFILLLFVFFSSIHDFPCALAKYIYLYIIIKSIIIKYKFVSVVPTVAQAVFNMQLCKCVYRQYSKTAINYLTVQYFL